MKEGIFFFFLQTKVKAMNAGEGVCVCVTSYPRKVTGCRIFFVRDTSEGLLMAVMKGLEETATGRSGLLHQV
jgi:hypothetical protein